MLKSSKFVFGNKTLNPFKALKWRLASQAKNPSLFSASPLACSLLTEVERQQLSLKLWNKKEELKLTIDEIANKLNYTNVYTAQILNMQVPLNPNKLNVLEELGLLDSSNNDYHKFKQELIKSPNRRYENNINQEPHVYRMIEAVNHNGLSLKQIINEKFGDGIMSAIDFYISVEKTKGKLNEDRVVITFDGKFLPFAEQNKN